MDKINVMISIFSLWFGCLNSLPPLRHQFTTYYEFLLYFVDVTNVALLALMLFIQNICLSVQDISVDALAVAVLASDDVGLGNVAQVVGYKLGGVVGGKFVWYYLRPSNLLVCLI